MIVGESEWWWTSRKFVWLAVLFIQTVWSQNIITCDTSAFTISSAGTYTLSSCSAPSKIVHINANTNAVTLSVISSTIQSIQVSSGGSVAIVLSSSTLTSASTSNIVVGALPSSITLSLSSAVLTTSSLANVYITPSIPAGVANLAIVSSSLSASGGSNVYFGGAVSGIGLSISGGSWSSFSHSVHFASSVVGNPSTISVTIKGAATISSTSASALYFGSTVSNVGLSFLDASTLVQASSSTVNFAASTVDLRMTITSCTISSTGASSFDFGGPSSSVTLSATSASIIASTLHNFVFASSVTVSSLSLTISGGSLLRSGTSGTSSANVAISGSSSNLFVTITGSSVLSNRGVGLGHVYVGGGNDAARISVVSATLSSAGYNWNLGTVTALGLHLESLVGVTSGGQSVLLAATSGSANTIVATSTSSWSAGGGVLLVQGATTQLLFTLGSSTMTGISGHLLQFAGAVSSLTVSVVGSSLTASAGNLFQFSGSVQSLSIVGTSSTNFISARGFLAATSAVSTSSLSFSGATFSSPSLSGSFQFAFTTLSSTTITFGSCVVNGAYGGLYADSTQSTFIVVSSTTGSIGAAYPFVGIQSGMTSSGVSVVAASVISQGSALVSCGGTGIVSSVGISVSSSTIVANGNRNVYIATSVSSSSISFISSHVSAASADSIYITGSVDGFSLDVTSSTISVAASSSAALRVDGAVSSSTFSFSSVTISALGSSSSAISLGGAMAGSSVVLASVTITAHNGARFSSMSTSSVVSIAASNIAVSATGLSFSSTLSSSSVTLSTSTITTSASSSAALLFGGSLTSVTLLVSSATISSPSTTAVSFAGVSTSGVISIVSCTVTSGAASIQTSASMSGGIIRVASSTMTGSRNFYRTASVVGETLEVTDSVLSASTANIEFAASWITSSLTIAGLSTVTSAGNGWSFTGGSVQSCTVVASGTGVAISSASYNMYASQSITTLAVFLLGGSQLSANGQGNLFLTTTGTISGVSISVASAVLLTSASTFNIFLSAVRITSTTCSITGATLKAAASASEGFNVGFSGTVVGASLVVSSATMSSLGRSNVYFPGAVSASTISLTSTSVSSAAINLELGSLSTFTIAASATSWVSGSTNIVASAFTNGGTASTVAISACGTITGSASNFHVSGGTASLAFAADASAFVATTSSNFILNTISSSTFTFLGTTVNASTAANFQFTDASSLGILLSSSSSWSGYTGNVLGSSATTSLALTIASSSQFFAHAQAMQFASITSSSILVTTNSLLLAEGVAFSITGALMSTTLSVSPGCTITSSGAYAFMVGGASSGSSFVLNGAVLTSAGVASFGTTVSLVSIEFLAASRVSTTQYVGVTVGGMCDSSSITVDGGSTWVCASATALSFGSAVTSATILIRSSSVTLSGLATSLLQAQSTMASSHMSIVSGSVVTGASTTTIFGVSGGVSSSDFTIGTSSAVTGGSIAVFGAALNTVGLYVSASSCTAASRILSVSGSTTSLTFSSTSSSTLIAQQDSAVVLGTSATHASFHFLVSGSSTITALSGDAFHVGTIASGSLTMSSSTISSAGIMLRVACPASLLVLSMTSASITSSTNLQFEDTISTSSIIVTNSALRALSGSNCLVSGAGTAFSMTFFGASTVSASAYNWVALATHVASSLVISGSSVSLTSSGATTGNFWVSSFAAPASVVSIAGGASVIAAGANLWVDGTVNTLSFAVSGASTLRSIGASLTDHSRNVHIGGAASSLSLTLATSVSISSYGPNIFIGGALNSASTVSLLSVHIKSGASSNIGVGGLGDASGIDITSSTLVSVDTALSVFGSSAQGSISITSAFFYIFGTASSSPSASLLKYSAITADPFLFSVSSSAATVTFRSPTFQDFIWCFVDGGSAQDAEVTLTQPSTLLFDDTGNASSHTEVSYVRISNGAVWTGSSGTESSSSVISVSSPSLASTASSERLLVLDATSQLLFTSLTFSCVNLVSAYSPPIAVAGPFRYVDILLSSMAVTAVGPTPIAALDFSGCLMESAISVSIVNSYFRTHSVVLMHDPAQYSIFLGCSWHTSAKIDASSFASGASVSSTTCTVIDGCWASFSRSRSRTASRQSHSVEGSASVVLSVTPVRRSSTDTASPATFSAAGSTSQSDTHTLTTSPSHTDSNTLQTSNSLTTSESASTQKSYSWSRSVSGASDSMHPSNSSTTSLTGELSRPSVSMSTTLSLSPSADLSQSVKSRTISSSKSDMGSFSHTHSANSRTLLRSHSRTHSISQSYTHSATLDISRTTTHTISATPDPTEAVTATESLTTTLSGDVSCTATARAPDVTSTQAITHSSSAGTLSGDRTHSPSTTLSVSLTSSHTPSAMFTANASSTIGTSSSTGSATHSSTVEFTGDESNTQSPSRSPSGPSLSPSLWTPSLEATTSDSVTAVFPSGSYSASRTGSATLVTRRSRSLSMTSSVSFTNTAPLLSQTQSLTRDSSETPSGSKLISVSAISSSGSSTITSEISSTVSMLTIVASSTGTDSNTVQVSVSSTASSSMDASSTESLAESASRSKLKQSNSKSGISIGTLTPPLSLSRMTLSNDASASAPTISGTLSHSMTAYPSSSVSHSWTTTLTFDPLSQSGTLSSRISASSSRSLVTKTRNSTTSSSTSFSTSPTFVFTASITGEGSQTKSSSPLLSESVSPSLSRGPSSSFSSSESETPSTDISHSPSISRPHGTETFYYSITHHTAHSTSPSPSESWTRASSLSGTSSVTRSRRTRSTRCSASSSIVRTPSETSSPDLSVSLSVHPRETPTLSISADQSATRSRISMATFTPSPASPTSPRSASVTVIITLSIVHSNTTSMGNSSSLTVTRTHVYSLSEVASFTRTHLRTISESSSETATSTTSFSVPSPTSTFGSSQTTTLTDLESYSTTVTSTTTPTSSVSATPCCSTTWTLTLGGSRTLHRVSPTVAPSASRRRSLTHSANGVSTTVTLMVTDSSTVIVTSSRTTPQTKSSTSSRTLQISDSSTAMLGSQSATAHKTTLSTRLTKTNTIHVVANSGSLLSAGFSSFQNSLGASVLSGGCLFPVWVFLATLIVCSTGTALVFWVCALKLHLQHVDPQSVLEPVKHQETADSLSWRILFSKHAYIGVFLPCHARCIVSHFVKAMVHLLVVVNVFFGCVLLLQPSSTVGTQVCCFLAAAAGPLSDVLVELLLLRCTTELFRKSLLDETSHVSPSFDELGHEYALTVEVVELRRQINDCVAIGDGDGNDPVPRYVNLDSFVNDIESLEDKAWVDTADLCLDLDDNNALEEVVDEVPNDDASQPPEESRGMRPVEELHVHRVLVPWAQTLAVLLTCTALLILVALVASSRAPCGDSWVTDGLLLCLLCWDGSIVQGAAVVVHFLRNFVLEQQPASHPQPGQFVRLQ